MGVAEGRGTGVWGDAGPDDDRVGTLVGGMALESGHAQHEPTAVPAPESLVLMPARNELHDDPRSVHELAEPASILGSEHAEQEARSRRQMADLAARARTWAMSYELRDRLGQAGGARAVDDPNP